MIIYLAPSKTQRHAEDIGFTSQLPLLADAVPAVAEALKAALEEQGLASFYRISNSLAARLKTDLANSAAASPRPALAAFDGLVFKYFDAAGLSPAARQFAEGHLRIASGLYGLLRPSDGIHFYRLDWGDSLYVGKTRLVDYWVSRLVPLLKGQQIIGLASKEYAAPLQKSLPEEYHEVFFYEQRPDGRLQAKATPAKMARGELARLICEAKATDLAAMRKLAPRGFVYAPSLSTEKKTVYVMKTDG